MTMTEEHKRKLAAGRKRKQRELDREAIVRVKAYRRWLQAGSKVRAIPAIPSDNDYKVARRAGVSC